MESKENDTAPLNIHALLLKPILGHYPDLKNAYKVYPLGKFHLCMFWNINELMLVLTDEAGMVINDFEQIKSFKLELLEMLKDENINSLELKEFKFEYMPDPKETIFYINIRGTDLNNIIEACNADKKKLEEAKYCNMRRYLNLLCDVRVLLESTPLDENGYILISAQDLPQNLGGRELWHISKYSKSLAQRFYFAIDYLLTDHPLIFDFGQDRKHSEFLNRSNSINLKNILALNCKQGLIAIDRNVANNTFTLMLTETGKEAIQVDNTEYSIKIPGIIAFLLYFAAREIKTIGQIELVQYQSQICNFLSHDTNTSLVNISAPAPIQNQSN